MRNDRQVPSCSELNGKDLVGYLSKLGIEPAFKKKGYEHWYHSPLNPPDKTPSFRVDTRTNRWRDFSDGRSGSLVDFGILYHNCSVSDFLVKFKSLLILPVHILPAAETLEAGTKSKNEVKTVKSITSPALISYLHSRGIPLEIANQYCGEVHYENNKGSFYALGFENKSGGYALRSKYFKGATIPNDITHINNGASDVAVFEGFFSFLSFVTMNPDMNHSKKDYVILNTLSHFEKARITMEQYEGINLYLDRDKSGLEKSAYAASLSAKYKDWSGFYEGYKDCNKFLLGEPVEETMLLENKSRSIA